MSKRTTKQQQIAAYLPPALVERLRHVAQKNHRSMNAELTVALEQYLARQERELADERVSERLVQERTL
jgi:predicted transcriptional regulator